MLSAFLTAFATLAPLFVQGVEIPKNDGWVTDLAKLLTPDQERSLEALMESYKAGTGHEIALLTVTELGGQPIERYALEVGRAWKIGSKETDNGALLVVSKNDRKIRIEVARGLEDKLTDSIAGRIIRNEITPRFRAGDFHGGLRGGIEAMHAAIGGQYKEPVSRRAPPQMGALLMVVLVIGIVLAGLLGRGKGKRRGGSAGSFVTGMLLGGALGRSSRGVGSGRSGGGFGGGGFGGFGGGGGFRGGGASGGW